MYTKDSWPLQKPESSQSSFHTHLQVNFKSLLNTKLWSTLVWLFHSE